MYSEAVENRKFCLKANAKSAEALGSHAVLAGGARMSASAHELTERSTFVFEGAVRRVGAVTTSGIEPTHEMAVVHVTKILKRPAVLAGFTGQEITVHLHEHERVHEGLRAVFFTNGLHFGEGLAVREVGRLEGHEAGGEKQVHEAIERASDEQLS